MTDDRLLTALAPIPESFDPEWSTQTLADIRSVDWPAPRRSHGRRPLVVGVAAGLLTLGTATAVAVGGPVEVVRDVLTQFTHEPNTTGNALGALEDPQLVAKFETGRGIFAVWVATPTSTAGVCYAISDATWDGSGTPTRDQLDYGCGGETSAGPGGSPQELTRPDQLGGFFKDGDGPMVYGVSPYTDAVSVRVLGDGVDRTLPVRSDSHGYGAALPEAGHAAALTLTFLDEDGQALGTKRLAAPVG